MSYDARNSFVGVSVSSGMPSSGWGPGRTVVPTPAPSSAARRSDAAERKNIATVRNLVYTAQRNYDEKKYTDKDRQVHAIMKEVNKSIPRQTGWIPGVGTHQDYIFHCYYEHFKKAGLLEPVEEASVAAQKIQEQKAAAEHLAAERELAQLFAPQPPISAPEPPFRAQDYMNKRQFRAMRARAGFPLNGDQHVCHIIAESNGGANHIDNYYVAAGSLNQSLGNRNDSYLAEAAGLEQTKKAVAVSRTTGYTGPGAEELIEMAEAARKGLPVGGAAAPPPQGGALYYDQVTPQQMAQLSICQREALESQRRAAKEQYESSTFTKRERILHGTW